MDNTAEANAATTTRADDVDDVDVDVIVRWSRRDFLAVVACAPTTRVADIITFGDIFQVPCYEARSQENAAQRMFNLQSMSS